MPKNFYYGGQAVIEGVMMRGRRNISVAVRRRDGSIIMDTQPLKALYTSRARELPLVRGIIALVETLVLAVQILLFSANVSAEEEGEAIPAWFLWVIMLLAISFGVGLFVVVPLLLTRLPFLTFPSSLVANLVEGIIRIAVFLLYLWGIGFLPSIHRVFAYHGAEHKTINAYEQGAPLEIEEVRKYSTAHSRCGTSFLLIIFVLAIFAFVFLGYYGIWLSLLFRLLLLPVIAALSYEVVRLGVAWAHQPVVRALLAPGLALQAMSTRKPDDSQLEVAILALKGVMEADARGEPGAIT